VKRRSLLILGGTLILTAAVFLGREDKAGSPSRLPSPEPQAPAQPRMTHDDLVRESLTLNLPEPPPLGSPKESVESYYRTLDKLVPGNLEAARIAQAARRVYHEAQVQQRRQETRAKMDKEAQDRRSKREAERTRREAERPPRLPDNQRPAPLIPTPKLGPAIVDQEPLEVPPPTPPVKRP
jgi:hypothetical protein